MGAQHNEQAREVLAAWRADRPIRVPLLCGDSFIQHGLWAGEAGLDYVRYYTDPEEMLRVQLEAARRRRELPIYDLPLGQPPESWPVTVDFWPVPAPGWLGCEISFRGDACPNHRPLNLDREAAEAMPMPDPRTGGLLATMADFRRRIQQRCQAGLSFLGRPVGPVHPGVDHAGVFAMALDVRGPDIMADMYEDGDFAARFLLKMAEWCDALENRDWLHLPQDQDRGPEGGKDPGQGVNHLGRRVSGTWCLSLFSNAPATRPYFRNTDHGIDMLSAETYEQFLLPVILEMNRRRGTPLPSGLHHCGRGQHLLPVIRKHYPLQRVDDLTFPLIDVARARRDVGPDVWMTVVIADAIVRFGPAERIRQTVRDLMASGAKGGGRLALSVGDMLPGTPLEHRVALYEAVKEFGAY